MTDVKRNRTLRRRLDELAPLLAGVPCSLEFTADGDAIVAMLVPEKGVALTVRARSIVDAIVALDDELARLVPSTEVAERGAEQAAPRSANPRTKPKGNR